MILILDSISTRQNHLLSIIWNFYYQRKFKFIESYYLAPVKTEKSTPAPDPIFIQNSDSGSCSGSGKNRRLRSESTPAPRPVFTRALRLRDHLQFRDEHCTGLGLDWIRTITICLGFGLDLNSESFQKFRIRTRIGLRVCKTKSIPTI